jgi:hypothetical protein
MARRLLLPILLMFFNLLATTSAHAYRGGGYGMGPGMMYGQGGQGYGMGSGMMYGPGYGMGPDMCGYGGDPKELRQVYEMLQQYAEDTYPLRKEYFAWLRSFPPIRRIRPRCTSWPSRSKPFGASCSMRPWIWN